MCDALTCAVLLTGSSSLKLCCVFHSACRSSGLRTQEQGRIWYFRGDMCNRRKGGKLMRLKHCFGKALSEEVREMQPLGCEHFAAGL